jgi:hypothetical protein
MCRMFVAHRALLSVLPGPWAGPRPCAAHSGCAWNAGRGYQGNRTPCESETVLREWLHSYGVIFDEAHLPAALTRLETATLPGSTSRLLRSSALHRSYPITFKPPPSRALVIDGPPSPWTRRRTSQLTLSRMWSEDSRPARSCQVGPARRRSGAPDGRGMTCSGILMHQQVALTLHTPPVFDLVTHTSLET